MSTEVMVKQSALLLYVQEVLGSALSWLLAILSGFCGIPQSFLVNTGIVFSNGFLLFPFTHAFVRGRYIKPI
jgi:hypothetical protein